MVRERKGGPGTISCTTNVNGALLSLQVAHIFDQYCTTNVSGAQLSLQTMCDSSQYCTIAVLDKPKASRRCSWQRSTTGVDAVRSEAPAGCWLAVKAYSCTFSFIQMHACGSSL